MKVDRVFVAAVALSIGLHLLLLRLEADAFGEVDTTVYIPVTLTPAAEIERERAREFQEMIVPELPDGAATDGAVVRRGSLSALEDRFLEIVVEEIERRKFVPDESRYYGLIGNVTVGFVVGPHGRFHQIGVVRSSGDALLDATALRAVRATDGLIERPAWAGSRELTVQLVVKYQYRL